MTETFGEPTNDPPVLKEYIKIHGEIFLVKKAVVEWPSAESNVI